MTRPLHKTTIVIWSEYSGDAPWEVTDVSQVRHAGMLPIQERRRRAS